MWIAKIAPQRPYTFVVLALLTALLGVFTNVRIPIDIFPNINIPMVAAIWSYTGLSPDDISATGWPTDDAGKGSSNCE